MCQLSHRCGLYDTLEPKFLYLSNLGFEVTSSALVGLNAFFLPNEGSSELLKECSWRGRLTH